jgi:two-component system KDP operon response regulator KdpE
METNTVSVLIIEDEKAISSFLKVILENKGYQITVTETAGDGLSALSKMPDIIILDLGLPDRDGMEIIPEIREWSQIPIIIVSARGREKDKVLALDIGADDYLTKPFCAEELLARMRVALRHADRLKNTVDEESSHFTNGGLSIDYITRRVFIDDREIHLTPLEYRLLTVLARHTGKVLTHQYLLKEVWGIKYIGQNHYVRVFMANLRNKIEKDPAYPRYLLTEQGIGYRLADYTEE